MAKKKGRPKVSDPRVPIIAYLRTSKVKELLKIHNDTGESMSSLIDQAVNYYPFINKSK